MPQKLSKHVPMEQTLSHRFYMYVGIERQHNVGAEQTEQKARNVIEFIYLMTLNRIRFA